MRVNGRQPARGGEEEDGEELRGKYFALLPDEAFTPKRLLQNANWEMWIFFFVCRRYDRNRDGRLDFDEFKDLMVSNNKNTKGGSNRHKD